MESAGSEDAERWRNLAEEANDARVQAISQLTKLRAEGSANSEAEAARHVAYVRELEAKLKNLQQDQALKESHITMTPCSLTHCICMYLRRCGSIRLL